jgi:hypothetical protein
MSTTDSSFHPYSHSSDPASIAVPASGTILHFGRSKSDLYAWREIFQLYLDTAIFQGLGERDRGERSVEDAEERLTKFFSRLNQVGLSNGKRLTLKESKTALQGFLQLNMFLLNIKKVRRALVRCSLSFPTPVTDAVCQYRGDS